MEWALLAKRVMPGLVPGIHVFAAPRQERLSWPGRSPATTKEKLGRNMIAARPVDTWFETRGVAALLTMRVSDLIMRSIAQRCVSKDEATAPEKAPDEFWLMGNGDRSLLPPPACGERVGVRGTLDRVGLADSPPPPDRTGRCFASPVRSDLSPQAGRGESNSRAPIQFKAIRAPATAGIHIGDIA